MLILEHDEDFEYLRHIDGDVFLIDENAHKHFKDYFDSYKIIKIQSGEESKYMSNLDSIINKLLKFNLRRNQMIVGVGGGVVTDIAGFIASVYKRGTKLGLVPTTLLAQVDAAIGGKTAINYNNFKNLIGTFKTPEYIYVNRHFLKTLPKNEFKNGIAEMIKYGLIYDEKIYDILESNDIDKLFTNEVLQEKLISRSAHVKNEIVAHDPYDMGFRKILNFGHTLGHAIELLYHISHGQAVSIGMSFGIEFSHLKGDISEEFVKSFYNIMKSYQMSYKLDFAVDEVAKIVSQDKKSSYDKIEFILLKAIGEPYIFNTDIIEFKSVCHEVFKLWKERP